MLPANCYSAEVEAMGEFQSIDTEVTADALVMRVVTGGDLLDSEDVRRFTESFRQSVDSVDSSLVVVNLAGIYCVSSSVLAELVRHSLDLKQAGRSVRLCGLTESLRGEFCTMRLDSIIPLFESEESACT